MNQVRHTLMIVSSEVHGERINGSKAMVFAYYASWQNEPGWGVGVERSTQVMVAHGLVTAINDLLKKDEHPVLEVISDSPGFRKYIEEHAPSWLANAEQHSKDAGEGWTELATLWCLISAAVREPISRDEKKLFNRLRDFARAPVRQVAEQFFQENPERLRSKGLIFTDQDDPAPKLSWPTHSQPKQRED